MKALALGLLKGLVIGLVTAVLFAVLDTGNHMFGTKLVLFAVIGALAGMLAGKPVWRAGALGTSVLKAGVGIVLGVVAMAVLYYLADFELGTRRLSSHYALVGPIWGAFYAAFVELDERGRGAD